MAEPEKRMAKNYEITQALRIGDREVVFGIDPASDQPYFCALYHKIFEIIRFRVFRGFEFTEPKIVYALGWDLWFAVTHIFGYSVR